MPIKGIRAIVRGFIPQAVALGLNTVQFEGLIRSAYGQFYQRQAYLADFREMTGRARKRDPLRSIPGKYRPTAATVQPSEVTQVAKFNYGFKLHGHDTITGDEVEQHMIVASDTFISMDDAEAKAENQRYKYFPEVRIERIEREYVSVRQEGPAAPLPLDYQI